MVLVSESGLRDVMEDPHSTILWLNLVKAKMPQNCVWVPTVGFTIQQADQRAYSCNKEGPTGASSQCKTTSLNSSISNKDRILRNYATMHLSDGFFSSVFLQTVIYSYWFGIINLKSHNLILAWHGLRLKNAFLEIMIFWMEAKFWELIHSSMIG